MQELFFIFSAIGSGSIGYLLLRTGFQGTQEYVWYKKIGLGYLLGLIVIIPSIVLANNQLDNFIISTISITSILFLILFTKRVLFEEEDRVKLIEKKRKQELPLMVLTQSEKDAQNEKIEKNEKESNIKFNSGQSKEKRDIFKEKDSSVVKELRNSITQNRDEAVKDDKADLLKQLRDAAKGINKNRIKSDEDEEEEY